MNGCKVYLIDWIQTIIHSIKGSVARCSIINSDLILDDCYVVRVGDSFAHGETIKKAQSDAEAKHLQSQPIDERIRMFHEAFGGVDKIPASDLFDWHFKLTGSCEMGPKSFVHNKGINMSKDSFTVAEFVELTKDSYGGDVIKKLL